VPKVRVAIANGVVAGVMFTCAGAAIASPQAPITIAKSAESGAPTILVDSRGTINALWTAAKAGGLPTVRYAREPAGAKRFTQVRLPNMPSALGKPFIYEASHGVLEVVVTVNGTFALDAWTSTNDGASWTGVPTTPLETWEANGLTLQASSFFDAPGGPLDFSNLSGATGSVVQLNRGLSKATGVGTDIKGITIEGMALGDKGTLFVLGAPDAFSTTTVSLPFQAGTNTGEVTFPCGTTRAVAGNSYKLAAGRSFGVVAFAGCGHVWTRTIAGSGAIGPVVALAAGPVANASGEGTNGSAWVGLVAGRSGSFTAAYTVPGNDIGVAHSANGQKWKTAPGLVPAQGADVVYGEASRSLSQGVGTWFGLSPQSPSQGYKIQLMPLSKTYRPPAAPSAVGISSPRKAHLGSLAVTAPGAIAPKGFEKTGKATAKVVDALGGKVTAAIAVTYVKGTTTYDICSGSMVATLSAGKADAVGIPCANGATVIGGNVSDLPVVKKGYVATFTFTGRNGAVTLASKIS
jgi:hypothetical protein